MFPIEFSQYRKTDIFAPAWYLITMSGGIYGGITLFLILSVYLIIYFKKHSASLKNVLIFLCIVFTIDFVAISATQLYAKNIFHNPRPTQLYFEEKGLIENKGKDFFPMTLKERRIYLQKRLDSLGESLADIYPPILDSWIYDSEYSFPSGHSQSAFFFGVILSFVINKTVKDSRLKFFYMLLPLVWAIFVSVSRVVIGIHYPVDVSAGALIGVISGLGVISLKKVNRIYN